MPAGLAEVVAGLVESACDDARRNIDHSEAVNSLVAASRWNPALLMAATDEANHLADGSRNRQLEVAMENLQAAMERVQRRAY